MLLEMARTFVLCIFVELLLFGIAIGEGDINTNCVEVALKTSNDVDVAIKNCNGKPSNDAESSPASMQDLKEELGKLNEEYKIALKKETQRADENMADSRSEADQVTEDQREEEADRTELDAENSNDIFNNEDEPQDNDVNMAKEFVSDERKANELDELDADDLKVEDAMAKPFFWRRRRRSTRRRSWFRRRISIRRRTWRRRSAGRPGKPTYNGCSIPLGMYFPYKVAFTQDCNKHDICYYKEYHSRKLCDDFFYRNMLNTCGSYGSLKKFFCRRFAGIYYRAVSLFGKNHYG